VIDYEDIDKKGFLGKCQIAIVLCSGSFSLRPINQCHTVYVAELD
jgi:hypothetical protein